MPCARPLNPAAALVLASIGLAGIALLLAGLLAPDHPLPPIRTVPDQTPIALTPRPTATVTLAFMPVATPRSSFYVSVETYALLSPCGMYEATMPDQVLIQNARAGKNPVPNCVIAPIGH
jgi:hypothetical protein